MAFSKGIDVIVKLPPHHFNIKEEFRNVRELLGFYTEYYLLHDFCLRVNSINNQLLWKSWKSWK